jgi:hypothetical protein
MSRIGRIFQRPKRAELSSALYMRSLTTSEYIPGALYGVAAVSYGREPDFQCQRRGAPDQQMEALASAP